MDAFWQYAVFVVNSFIFLLIGRREAQQPFGAVGLAIAAAILMVLAGRAVAVYGCCAALTRSRWRITARHQHVLFWGGLRGALALALALGLPDGLPHRNEIVIVTFAVVAFSIFVQGLTMPPLLKKLVTHAERQEPRRE